MGKRGGRALARCCAGARHYCWPAAVCSRGARAIDGAVRRLSAPAATDAVL